MGEDFALSAAADVLVAWYAYMQTAQSSASAHTGRLAPLIAELRAARLAEDRDLIGRVVLALGDSSRAAPVEGEGGCPTTLSTAIHELIACTQPRRRATGQIPTPRVGNGRTPRR